MKKLLLSLFAIAGVAFASNAQNCGTGVSSCVPQSFDSVGLYPKPDSLACFVRGQQVDQTFYFKNYEAGQTVSGVTIDSIRIDEVTLTQGVSNSGICWSMNYANNVVPAGGTGCLNVTGTLDSSVPGGQYQLKIIVTVWTPVLGSTPTFDHYDAANLPGGGLFYWVRVINPADDCDSHPIDTVAGKTQTFIPYYGETLGINDIEANVSQLNVQPNPFGTATTVTFTAENRENYSLRLTNLLGEVVYAKDVIATVGKNSFTVENKGYANGVYLLNLTNGKSTITKRVVISE